MLAACRNIWIKLGLAALIAAGAAAASTVPAEAAETFELYTTYVNLAAPPGESITYSVEAINRGDRRKCFRLRWRRTATNGSTK